MSTTCEKQRIRIVVVIFLLIVISSIILQYKNKYPFNPRYWVKNHERCEIFLYSGSNIVVPWRWVAGSKVEEINILILIIFFCHELHIIKCPILYNEYINSRKAI